MPDAGRRLLSTAAAASGDDADSGRPHGMMLPGGGRSEQRLGLRGSAVSFNKCGADHHNATVR